MRVSLTTFLFAILLAATAWSQSTQRHPADPNAEVIGSMTIDLSRQSAVQRNKSLLGNEGGLATTITVFRSGDRIDYIVHMDSIKFVGDCPWVDEMNTPTFFNLVGRMAVTQGISMGYTVCPSSCGGGTPTTRVYVASCVQRFGYGSATRFVACSPLNYCMREYTVCCPNGPETPQIEMIRYEGGPCTQVGITPACESTCPL